MTEPSGASNTAAAAAVVDFMRRLQLRFDFDSTAVRLLSDVIKVTFA